MRFEFRVPDLLYKDTSKFGSVNTFNKKIKNYFGEIINISDLTKSSDFFNIFFFWNPWL